MRSPEEKHRIVLSVLRGEMSMAEAARREGISKATIEKWRNQLLQDALLNAANPSPSGREAALATEVDHLRAALGEAEAVGELGDEGREANPIRYLAAVRHHWLLVVAIVLLAAGSAVAYSVFAAKQYEARADILVTPLSSTDSSLDGLNVLQESGDSSSSSVLTEARLIKTPQVADAVLSQLGLKMSRRDLLDAIAVEPVSQANVLSIVATAPTATQAAQIANAFTAEVISERNERFQAEITQRLQRLRLLLAAAKPSSTSEAAALQTQIATLTPFLGEPDPTLRLASRAVPPTAPASPRVVISVAVATIAALLLGLGVAVGLETLKTRVDSEDELLFTHRLPILARVPWMRHTDVNDYLAGRSQIPEEARDAYRLLRENLATAGPTGHFPRTILITSAIRGEGKTISTLNLAITLAGAGLKVIAVDGDLRHPMLASVFGVASRGQGFADIFMKDDPLEPALVTVPGYADRIRLVLGNPGDALVSLLEPHRIRRGLERLTHEADVIIVDSPTLTEVPGDALTLAALVEAVLVVTRLGYTRPDELFDLRRRLAYRRIAPLGFIVTARRPRRGLYGFLRRDGREGRALKPVADAGNRGFDASTEQGQV